MEKGTIYLKLFGKLSLVFYKGEELVEITSDTKQNKMWKLLAFLICNRNVYYSKYKLYELLWDEKMVDDPANSLKVLSHKLRNFLKKEGIIPPGKKALVLEQGVYHWNKEIPCYTDADVLEDNDFKLRTAKDLNLTEEEKAVCYDKILAIYKGRFLNEFSEDWWVMPIQLRHQNIFIQNALDYATLQLKKKNYGHVIEIAQRVLECDTYNQNAYVMLIKAFAEQNSYGNAVQVFRYATDIFHKEFGMPFMNTNSKRVLEEYLGA